MKIEYGLNPNCSEAIFRFIKRKYNISTDDGYIGEELFNDFLDNLNDVKTKDLKKKLPKIELFEATTDMGEITRLAYLATQVYLEKITKEKALELIKSEEYKKEKELEIIDI